MMANTLKKIRLTELLNSKIVTADGTVLGHVADIQLSRQPAYKVEALLYGWSGWMHRWHMLNPFRGKPRRAPAPRAIPWDAVASFECSTIRLKPEFRIKRLPPVSDY